MRASKAGSRSRVARRIVGGVALVIVLGIVWLWWSSRLPETYSPMDMGVTIGSAAHAHGSNAEGTVSVDTLVGEVAGVADVRVELTARQSGWCSPDGQTFDGVTLNGQTPGPTIRARQGDLVEVVLHNESVADGTTLHWHGIDVPGAMDGVAGVTQDAVAVGASFTYRFVAKESGTYWYHSHQMSHWQVVAGMLRARS